MGLANSLAHSQYNLDFFYFVLLIVLGFFWFVLLIFYLFISIIYMIYCRFDTRNKYKKTINGNEISWNGILLLFFSLVAKLE